MSANPKIRIELPASPPYARRDGRFFARAIGTSFDVKAQGAATEIDLYDEIGRGGVTAKAFRERLKAAPGDVKLKINSPGGDVFDGIAIYNDLVDHPGNVLVEVTGVAASAASIIAMAGDTIAMAENAFMMIHNAWAVSIGDKETHATTSSALGKIDGSLAATYANRTKIAVRQIATMMDNETWLTAKAATERGFADSIIKPNNGDARAAFDVSIYAKAPAELVARFAAGKDRENENTSAVANTPNIRDVERTLRVNLPWASRAQARKMAFGAWSAFVPEDVKRNDEIAALAARVRGGAAEIAALRGN